jgi:hypothetical protein
MTIVRGDLRPLAVGELLDRNLRIPPYQRPYRWRTETAQALLDDIWLAFAQDQGSECALGSVILYRPAVDGHYDIVDGQQRLLTLRLLLALLRQEEQPELEAAGELPPDEAPAIVKVYLHLRTAVRVSIPAERRPELASFVEQRCTLVQVVTDDEDEAFRFFDSQNYRGKPLKPHDLLKAHHLRALTGVREEFRSTVVGEWERVDDDELEHLFSRYLYRIAQWSHGRPARREFTVDDVDLFKGVPASAQTPAERYHLAAQTSDASAVGAVAFVPAVRQLLNAGDLRARFQLDAPVIAGSEFFARVSFLLDDQRNLASMFEDFLNDDPRVRKAFGGSASKRITKNPRYRYVSELFLAAIFYWTNKFHNGELDGVSLIEQTDEIQHAWNKLFMWAFSLRLQRERVTWQSVNLRAALPLAGESKSGVFEILRDAMSTEVLRHLFIEPVAEPDHGRDEELAELLREIGGAH